MRRAGAGPRALQALLTAALALGGCAASEAERAQSALQEAAAGGDKCAENTLKAQANGMRVLACGTATLPAAGGVPYVTKDGDLGLAPVQYPAGMPTPTLNLGLCQGKQGLGVCK